MIIGVPKEIKSDESRVGLTPAGASALINSGHRVNIEKGAGFSSGFNDNDYSSIGCEIIDSANELFSTSEMIIKVKEPIEEEYKLIKPNHLIFILDSYFVNTRRAHVV